MLLYLTEKISEGARSQTAAAALDNPGAYMVEFWLYGLGGGLLVALFLAYKMNADLFRMS